MRTLPLSEAVEQIPDGAVLMVGGFMGVGTPECLIDELCRQERRDPDRHREAHRGELRDGMLVNLGTGIPTVVAVSPGATTMPIS